MCIRDSLKRTESEDLLITVLGARSCDHNHGRVWSRTMWQGECAFKVELSVLKCDHFLLIRKQFGFFFHFINIVSFDTKRPESTVLCELTLDHVPFMNPIPYGESYASLELKVDAAVFI